jgi:flagellar motor switch protein FliM
MSVATTIEPQPGAQAEPSSPEPYDFLRPQRIPKEQWAALQAVCTKLAAALQALLAARLRQSVAVTAGRLEEMSAIDAVGTLTSPCAAYVFDPGDGMGANGVIDLGAALASYIVDRLLGGPGTAPDATRALTDIEQRVLKDVVARALGAVGDVLKDAGRLKLTLSGYEGATDQLAATIGADAVVLATFDIKVEKPIGTLTLCLPLTALAAFFQEQRTPSTRSNRSGPVARPESRSQLEAAIRRARVPVMVRFPAITLSARAVAMLTPGQTIQTALPLDVPVEVRVNGRLRFLGAPGQVHGAVGVRIVRTVPVDASGPGTPSRARIL